MTMLATRGQLRASLIRWALFMVPVVLLLGFLSSELSGSTADNPWFVLLIKPATYPPPATFGIVWTILYVLMGVAAAMVASALGARGRGNALLAFCIQLLLNLAWSPLFFAYHQITGALILLVLLDVAVAVTLVMFWRIRKVAGLIMVPYLAWVLFATLLTWQILQLNPAADGEGYGGRVQRIEL
jgi:translocator protein